MRKQQHKNQRVGIFVDVQNMYYSAKNLHNAKVNFQEIMKRATAGRALMRAICYVVKAEESGESGFFEALENLGFEIRVKDLQIFYGGAKKGDWDVGIAMDIVRLAAKLDVVILVSGDGDFMELLEYAEASGCRTEVMAFGKATSSKLKQTAHEFIDMDGDKKFLMRGARRPQKRKR